MRNARTELQYQIILNLADQAREAGLLTAEESAAVKRLAAEKYQAYHTSIAEFAPGGAK